MFTQPVEQSPPGTQPSDSDRSAGRHVNSGQEAMAAVQVGLYVAAVRCLLTYIVAPALGSIGMLLGPVGLGLQLLGAVTSAAGARRLWRLGHRARVPYAAVALTLCVLTAASVLQLAGGALR